MNSKRGGLIGRVLHDSHRITRLIGQGGMGAVFEAEHIRLPDRRFAIKVLHGDKIGSQPHYVRFQREAEVTTRLGHPNIVDVHDFYETDDGPCIVMELLEGEDLQQRLDRMEPLSMGEVVAVLRQTGSALQAAHDKGVVHRDLKPANIFLIQGGEGPPAIRVKVLDFGISKIQRAPQAQQQASLELTREGDVLGTPRYMSPEVARAKQAVVDHRADVFSLAVIACEVLTGESPFEAETMPGTICKILREEPAIGPMNGQPMDARLRVVLERGLAKESEQRYGQISELVEDLCAALEALQAPPRPTLSAAERGLREGGTRTVDLQGDADEPMELELGLPREEPPLSGVSGTGLPTSPVRPRRAGGRLGVVLGGALMIAVAGGAVGWLVWPDISRWLFEGDGGGDAPLTNALLLVETKPRDADVFIDGELATTSPVRLPRSGRSVEVLVKAMGYQSRTLRVKCDRDRSVIVRLRPAGSR
jgi:eukaryotic-like serine/threonine-protein kinase